MRDASAAQDSAFSKEEAEVIKKINVLGSRIYEHRFRIGLLINTLIERKGGCTYGDATLSRLASHPHLQFSEEQLRRCWQYYRLKAAFKDTLDGFKLPYSHLYQLSRLLGIPDEQVRDEAIRAMAEKDRAEKMTTSALAKHVTTHLKSIRKPKQGVVATSVTVAKSDPGTTPPPTSESFETASETVFNLAQDLIKGKALPFAKVRAATNRLGYTYVELVRRLAEGDSDVRTDVEKVIAALSDALKVCEATKGA